MYNYPIIMTSMSRWDGDFSSASISLAKEFSKTHKVFYIDNPITIKEFIKEFKTDRIQKRRSALLFGKNIYRKIEGENLTAVTPRITLTINWLPKGFMYDILNKINNKIIFNTLKQILVDHNIKDFIFFNSFNPFYAYQLPSDFKPKLYIYQSRDDISQLAYVAKHGARFEKKCIECSDVALATSKELTRLLSSPAKPVLYFPNAADTSIFKEVTKVKFDRPKELIGFENKKIIGYTGNICMRIDYDLLYNIAKSNPDKIILMVGPRQDKIHSHLNLDELPNIIFVGAKKINELPAYLQYIDCAIIPFKQNKLTKSIYPLKINEYLAAGKPVVSTNFSEDINEFADYIYLTNETNSFSGFINKAIEENSEDQIKNRVLAAEKNSWKSRVGYFWEIVETHLN